jgi:hypothetical protein
MPGKPPTSIDPVLSRRAFTHGGLAAATLLVSGSAPAQEMTLAQFGVSPEASPQQNDRGVRAALRAAAGGPLTFSAGRYRFALTSPWQLGPGVSIVGAGKGSTVLERTDRDPCNWFDTRDHRGANAFRGFTAIGNGRAVLNGNGGFLLASTTSAAAKPLRDISLSAVELRNFGGDGWIFFLVAPGSTHGIEHIAVDGDCSFVSAPGNARGPSDRAIWSSAIIIQGSLEPAGQGGIIRNATIGSVSADIPHIKSLCIIWGAVDGARIVRPQIERCATIGIGSDSGGYALVVGNETLGAANPERVQIIGPVINACQSVGLYLVSWGGDGGSVAFDGTSGSIANVTDTHNGILPKGAIAATIGATTVTIRNLRAVNCSAALDLALGPGTILLVDGVEAEGIPANQNGVRIQRHYGGNEPDRPSQIELRNLHIQSSAAGVTGLRFITTRSLGRVVLGGEIDIDVPFIGVSAYRESGSGEVAPFESFSWQGEATIRNAIAGAIVLRDNASPLMIDAQIRIQRGDAPGPRDHRFKADGARGLQVNGSIAIEDLRAGDNPAWEARVGRRADRAFVRPGAISIEGPAQLRAVPESLGAPPD